MSDNRNMILAVILSGIVLLLWQYFYNVPQMEKQRAQQQQAELQKSAQKPADNANPSSAPPQPGNAAPTPAAPTAATAPVVNRDKPMGNAQGAKTEPQTLPGSISLKGARIDDLSLVKSRKPVDPASPPFVLYSPSGPAEPYYAEFGWVPAAGSTVRVPD